MWRWKNPTERPAWTIAGIVSLIALVCGALWVLATDILLYELISDPILIARIETAKGWMFIGLGAAFLFWLTYRMVRRLARTAATLRAVIDSIADGVIMLARDGTIAAVNPAAISMLGAKSADELLGMDAEEFSQRFHVSRPDGSIVDPKQYISVRALRGEVHRHYKIRLFPPGRGELDVVCTAAPVRPDPDAAVELAVTVFHDVTELERLERIRDQFFSAAAHALKTPVSVIMAHMQMLLSGHAPEIPSLAAIERQCRKVNRLTENILVLARLRSGTLRLHPEPVACAELVDEVARQMKRAFAHCELTTDIKARPVVFADRERLGLAVRNLVELACRRSIARTEIRIILEHADGHARIGVRYQLDQDLPGGDTAGYAGLDVEQHIVTSLIEAANGKLNLERDARVYTEWLELPAMGGLHA